MKIGFYYRNVYSKSNRKILYRIPIQRYLCNRKGCENICNHRTFSLLPYFIIPYKLYDIETHIEIAQHSNAKDQNEFKNSFDFWTDICVLLDSNTGYKSISEIINTITIGIQRLALYLKLSILKCKDYILSRYNPGISLRYFKYQHDFLFGIPSQKRF